MDATLPAQQRAAAAEDAVIAAYVHRYGPVAWAHAATDGDGARTWHYWWHAHLVHVLAEAERHRPSSTRRRRIAGLLRGVTLRTAGTWITPFYDDIAWMGLALAETRPHGRARARIARLLAGAVDPTVGALPWRTRSDLFNAPANGPAAIVLAPSRHRDLADRLATWIAAVLDDSATGLVRDGIEHGVVRPDLWTYNQGVAIGAALALDDPERAGAMVRAVERWCAPDDGLFGRRRRRPVRRHPGPLPRSRRGPARRGGRRPRAPPDPSQRRRAVGDAARRVLPGRPAPARAPLRGRSGPFGPGGGVDHVRGRRHGLGGPHQLTGSALPSS
ncbi:MAG: hypothetical protein ABT07_05155 [Microbacterium sp. SCN 70-10]|nr:MAG: hypothetical protein ABT07_05155 [Microbacterium sp. SCN 70-10]